LREVGHSYSVQEQTFANAAAKMTQSGRQRLFIKVGAISV
jgi:hypothetical protein